MQRLIFIPLLMVATNVAAPQAWSGDTSGSPTCEMFYDKWDVPGAPPGILAMAGFGREVIAAQDCVAKGNVPMACEHWQKLLPVIDRTGPPLDEQRGAIEDLMRQHSCG